MDLTNVYAAIVTVFDLLGAATIVVGVVLAIVMALVSLSRGQGGAEAIRILRNVLGGAILLGLEVFVAADLIRTITEVPSLTNVLSLGLIVVIRTVLSFTIQIEIEGTLPWRKAALTSGAKVVSDAVKKATR
ncbi:MAG: hypothetical protein RLZZ600_838 [Actinomycetota bacterium]|jgi:uncharacterized membrane protein